MLYTHTIASLSTTQNVTIHCKFNDWIIYNYCYFLSSYIYNKKSIKLAETVHPPLYLSVLIK